MALKLLTDDELHRVAATIGEVEKTTSGEIRVNIHARRSWRERGLPIHEIARRHFYAMGMQATKNKTGVLIFLCVRDRAFHIVADEGIHKRIPQEYWDTVAQSMARHFTSQKFYDGICYAVREIGISLAREFPITEGDKNELSNDVLFS